MNRQTWAEIKMHIKPATRTRMEVEASRLSGELHLAQLLLADRFADGVEVPIKLAGETEDAT